MVNLEEFNPVEAALMDMARAIQITPTMHKEANSRYTSLSEHVDRNGSPLQDQVKEIYPSGSFAIHAAIRSNIKRDQHDVDTVLELDLPADSDPEQVLDNLYRAVKGDLGSKYNNFEIEQASRCITVTYSDGVTVDLMPVVRHDQKPERVGNLFHFKANKGERYHKEVNPKGFANYFNNSVETNEQFAQRFDLRRKLTEGKTFAEEYGEVLGLNERMMLEKAETQPMPDYLPLDQKSPRVVSLQILKRFRDKRYRKHDDHSSFRKPPSVVLAAIALKAPYSGHSLTEDLLSVATTIRNELINAERNATLVEVSNPTYEPDKFTDRWPENRESQQLWIADLSHLLSELAELNRVGFSPKVVKNTFNDLFGEAIADHVLNEHYKMLNNDVLAGRTRMTQDGKLAAPAIGRVLTGAAAAGAITPARANTGMGGDIKVEDN